MDANKDPEQCCIQINKFLGLFQLREQKDKPNSNDQQKTEDSIKRAV